MKAAGRPGRCVRLPHLQQLLKVRSGGQQSAKTVATRTLGRSATSLATARREGSPARADESWTIAPGSAPGLCLPARPAAARKSPRGLPEQRRRRCPRKRRRRTQRAGASSSASGGGLESSQSTDSAPVVIRDRYGCLSGPTPLTRRWTLNSTMPPKHQRHTSSRLREKRAARTGSSSRRTGFPRLLSYT